MPRTTNATGSAHGSAMRVVACADSTSRQVDGPEAEPSVPDSGPEAGLGPASSVSGSGAPVAPASASLAGRRPG